MGAPALAAIPASPSTPLPALPTPGTDWHPQGKVRARGHPFPAGPGMCCAPVPTLTPPPPSPGAAQGDEKSLGASTQSATLSNLRPDTEYVVMLRPRYVQQPAVPATLTARTRKNGAWPWAQPGTGMSSQHRDAPPVTVPHGDGVAQPIAAWRGGWNGDAGEHNYTVML